MTALRLVRLGLWLGLAYGLVEAAEAALLSLVPGALSWRTANSAYVLWVAPLVYGVVFTALAAVVALTATLRRGWPWDLILVTLLTFFGAYLACTLQGQILSNTASLILAAGIAATAHRIYRAHRLRCERLLLGTLPHLAGLVALLAVITVGAREVRERLAVATLPGAAAGRPNVLLLVIDTQRADHLSSYGYQRPTTPNLDHFAAEGTRYVNAIASSSWTLPTHATLMTGRQLHDHRAGVLRRPYLDGRFPTLAEMLQRQGYVTGGFVANTYWCGRQTGIDRGFIHYEDFYGNVGDALARTVLGRRLAYEVFPRFGRGEIPGRKRGPDIDQSLLRWIDQRGGRPFFAFVNYFDVHAPLFPPAPYAGRFSGHAGTVEPHTEIELGAIGSEMVLPSPERLQAMRDAYDESLLALDAELGGLFDSLRVRGLLDSTLVIVTGDHGESWGEHGMVFHGHSLYADQIQVPLILRWPGHVPAGQAPSLAVGLDRVAPTIAVAAGLAPAEFPSPPLLPGETGGEPVLAELARRSAVPGNWPASRGSVASLVTERWQFIEEESGKIELYDRLTDPDQLTDLAGQPVNAGFVASARSRLDAALLHTGLSWGGR